MADVEMGNLYDMNKGIMKSQKPLSKTKLREAKDKIKLFFLTDKYFMLLCHELRDYTVFNVSKEDSSVEESVKILVDECLINRGEVLSIEKTEDDLAYEIWIRNEEDIFCYYLFPYTQGVIEV